MTLDDALGIDAEALYGRYGRTVNRVLWRTLGADRDHDDLVQEVFERLLRSAPRMRDPERLDAFVLRVTVNTARSELRRRAVRRVLQFEADPPEPQVPGADFEARSLLRRTFALLDKLPVQERLAFTLRHIEGQELTVVAAACGCSLATIKRRLRRADDRFRRLAQDDPDLRARLDREEAP